MIPPSWPAQIGLHRGKRPIMGRIAATKADHVFVTSDNPRTEDPERIMDDVVAEMPVASYDRIPDREEAITRGCAQNRGGSVRSRSDAMASAGVICTPLWAPA